MFTRKFNYGKMFLQNCFPQNILKLLYMMKKLIYLTKTADLQSESFTLNSIYNNNRNGFHFSCASFFVGKIEPKACFHDITNNSRNK